MIDSRKLRGKIVENGLTIGKTADMVGLSGYTLGRQISNKKPMTIGTAGKLIKVLNIQEANIQEIFFVD